MGEGLYHHAVLTDRSLHELGEKIERLLNLEWCECHEFQLGQISKINGLYVVVIMGRCKCHVPDYVTP